MKKVRAIFLTNSYFFTGYFLFLLPGILFLLFTSKINGFLYLNPYHSKFLDTFFSIYTNAGDGLFSIAVFVLLLLLKRALAAWEVVITFLLSGLVAQVVKYSFPMPRPRTLLGDGHYPYFVDGLTLLGNASFPSGHTASAFGLATILSLSGGNRKLNFVYFAAALLVAYSRIYLGQHFLQDVLAGAVIGVACALLVYIAIDNHSSWFAKMKQAE